MAQDQALPTDADCASVRAEMKCSQIARFEASERDLVMRSVPRKYWCYVVSNCDPAIVPDPADRGGTWVTDRDWILKDIQNATVVWRNRQDEMHYVAVDGRAAENIRYYIEACWTSYDMEPHWREWLAEQDAL